MRPMMTLGSGFTPSERRAMIPDLIIALAFLAMIIAPAIVSIPPDRDEKDSL
jgi:hypothetical protein